MKVPPPPEPGHLAAIPPVLRVVEPDRALWRIYPTVGRRPQAWKSFRTWGPDAHARFDHHEPDESARSRDPERGVYYAALQIDTAVAETCQEARTIDRSLDRRELAAWQPAAPLRLLDLSSDWVLRVGATAALHAALKERCRAWARACYTAYPDVDGLAWDSAVVPGGDCVVLFERAKGKLPFRPRLRRRLDDAALLADLDRIAQRFGWLLV